MEYSEFLKKVKKVDLPRHHEVKGSLGVYDAYKWIRKNKWLNIGTFLTEKQFYFIIRNINNLLAKELALGHDVKLPHRLGTLEVRKRPTGLKIINGKLITKRPVNWEETLKLWSEDEEAYKDRILVRREIDTMYIIRHGRKGKCYCKNMKHFEFRPNRKVKIELQKNAKLNKVEAFLTHD